MLKQDLTANGKLSETDCRTVTVPRLQYGNDAVIYAAFPDAGLFKSENAGKAWTKLSTGLDGNNPLRVVATKGNSPGSLCSNCRRQRCLRKS